MIIHLLGGVIISKNLDRRSEALINENIKAEVVLLIDDSGNSLGAVKIQDALKIAQEKEYDLVCVAPEAKTPVCRLMDYSKYRYEMQRKSREAKKNQRVITLKEVWITPVMGENDFTTRLKLGRKFLAEGNKLKVTLRYRSMRLFALERGNQKMLEKFIEATEDIATVEQKPSVEGRNVSIILVPKKDNKK